MRGGIGINRAGTQEVDRGDRVSWVEEYLNTFAKTQVSAVEAARTRDGSYYDQIQNLMGPGHKTVESVVKDLQERTGLSEYLKRQNLKTAQEAPVNSQLLPPTEIFAGIDPKLRENIINLIVNKIKTFHGQISIPAIQHEILATFQNQGVSSQDIAAPEVAQFISNEVLKEIKNNTSNNNLSNIGKGVGVNSDDQNGVEDDFFAGLMPAKK